MPTIPTRACRDSILRLSSSSGLTAAVGIVQILVHQQSKRIEAAVSRGCRHSGPKSVLVSYRLLPGSLYEPGIEGRRQKLAKYLVTGAAGFIGRSIAAELIKRGENVRGVDNFIAG